MTVDDWKVFLKDGEKLYWSASSSLRHSWVRLISAIAFFAGVGLVYGRAAFLYPTLQAYCTDAHTSACAKAFFLRWPGTIASAGFVLVGIFSLFGMAQGWIGHYFAITDRRALWIAHAPWRKYPVKPYEADFVAATPKVAFGGIVFGTSNKSVRFFGIGEDQRDFVLSLISDLTKAQSK
jgi:hypothetical protein